CSNNLPKPKDKKTLINLLIETPELFNINSKNQNLSTINQETINQNLPSINQNLPSIDQNLPSINQKLSSIENLKRKLEKLNLSQIGSECELYDRLFLYLNQFKVSELKKICPSYLSISKNKKVLIDIIIKILEPFEPIQQVQILKI